MVRTSMAVCFVLVASHGIAGVHPPDVASDNDAASHVAFLIQESSTLALPVRVERAFLLTLHGAGEALARGDGARAVTLLRTFAFEVRSVTRAKRLRADAANTLIARAEEAIASLRRLR